MDGLIGKFDGVPVRLCRCGNEPIVYDGRDVFQIYCSCCNQAIKFCAAQDYNISFSMKRKLIEDWNCVVEVHK